MNKYECSFNSKKNKLAPVILAITALFAVASHANVEEGQDEEEQWVPTLSELAVLSTTAAVTCTNSTIEGNAASAVTVTQTNCYQEGEVVLPVSEEVVEEFSDEYYRLADITCDHYLTNLAGLTLEPGVYCFDEASTNTGGVLTLEPNSDDPEQGWVFKVEVGAFTGTDFVVKMNGDDPNACNVDWWVADAATVTRGDFIGNLYARGPITLTGSAPTSSFHGRALSNAAVTLTNSGFIGCEGQHKPVVKDPTDYCPVEAQSDIAYVKYTHGETTEVAFIDPVSKDWYKAEYFAASDDETEWMYPFNVPMTETIRDKTSVYATFDDKEFHIDLAKNVVYECTSNTCDIYPILESDSSLSLALTDALEYSFLNPNRED
jgi:hypothetical protein